MCLETRDGAIIYSFCLWESNTNSKARKLPPCPSFSGIEEEDEVSNRKQIKTVKDWEQKQLVPDLIKERDMITDNGYSSGLKMAMSLAHQHYPQD